MSEFYSHEATGGEADDQRPEQEPALPDEAARQLEDEQRVVDQSSPTPPPPVEGDEVAEDPPDEEPTPAQTEDLTEEDPEPLPNKDDDVGNLDDTDGGHGAEREGEDAPAGDVPPEEDAELFVTDRHQDTDDEPVDDGGGSEVRENTAAGALEEEETTFATESTDDGQQSNEPFRGHDTDGRGDTDTDISGGDDNEDVTESDDEPSDEASEAGDIAARIAAVTAAEERLITLERRDDEILDQYNQAFDAGADVSEIGRVAIAIGNAREEAFNELERLYDGIRDLTLEQRLAAIGASDMAPTGDLVASWDFHDIRVETRAASDQGVRYDSEGSQETYADPTSRLREGLLGLEGGGDSAALIGAELYSNYDAHVEDGDGRFERVTRDRTTRHLVVDYYCFAPVKDSTFRGFRDGLDPSAYDVERRLAEGRIRDQATSTAAHGLGEDTGRGLAIITSMTLNDRKIERMGHGAHVRVVVNPRDITPMEVRRILDEATNGRYTAEKGPVVPPEDMTEEELLAGFSDIDFNEFPD